MQRAILTLLFFIFTGCVACYEPPEVPAPSENNYFVKRFSRYIAVNAGSFKAIPGSWYGRYRIGSYTLKLDTNGRFTHCQSTCIGSYLTHGTWMLKGGVVVLDCDSGDAHSALKKPVVLNTDANIFHDTTLVQFEQKHFDLRNDTLFALDSIDKRCRMVKYIPYEWDNPFMQ